MTNQTWKIDGRTMNHAQLMEWKKKKKAPEAPQEPLEVEKPEKEVEVAKELKDEGYDARNSVEKEFDVLKEKGWANLDKTERARYQSHKKQLGK